MFVLVGRETPEREGEGTEIGGFGGEQSESEGASVSVSGSVREDERTPGRGSSSSSRWNTRSRWNTTSKSLATLSATKLLGKYRRANVKNLCIADFGINSKHRKAPKKCIISVSSLFFSIRSSIPPPFLLPFPSIFLPIHIPDS